MRKTLMLLRHGKSDWNTSLEADFDRPLAPRGKDAARKMAALMVEQDLEPELIITSPAARAAQTAAIVVAEIGDIDLVEDEALYEASLDDLLATVHNLPDDVDRALLVGHNPGFEELAAELSGDNGVVMKTCTLAVLQVKSKSWEEVRSGTARLSALYNPRDFEG
jgi:phosphohistidine phosphatase